MLPLLRGLFACLLLLIPSLAFSQQIWVDSFTGMSGSEKPNGYRYNEGIFGDQIQIFFSYTRISATAGVDAFINGVPAGFTCSFTDVPPNTGSGSCFGFVPYNCGKMTVNVRRGDTISNPPTIFTSQPVDVFIYDDVQCLPQCDSCQLGSIGQAPGKPVNVATGKLWYRTTDVALSGPFGLTFSRWYDNQSSYNAELGFGWRHSYSAFLDLSLNSQRLVKFFDEEGRVTYFNNVGGTSVHDQTSGADLVLSGGVYTLTTWNNFKYTFDSAGRLTSLTDRIGNVQTITRDGSNRIDFVTDALGRTLDFGYDASNKLVSVTSTPPGASLSFGYSGANCPAGNLCSATMPDNKTWTYEYTATGNNLTKVIDPLNHAEEINTYSGERLITQQTEGAQNGLTFAYPNGTTTTVTDALSRVTTYTYDSKLLLVTNVAGPGCGCGGGQSRAFTFDRFLRKTSETDGLGASHTINWTFGRDVTATYPNGFTDIVTAYPSPTARMEPLTTGVSRTTMWTYYPLTDVRRDLVQTETVPSSDTAGQNKVTTLTFNTQGLLTSRQEQGRIGGVVTTYTTNFGYHTRGRLQTVDGPRTDVTDVTTYAYYGDSDSDLAKRGQLQTVTDAAGNVTTYASGAAPFNTYTPYGQPRRVTDPNSVVREMTYDNRGRMTISTLKGVTGDPTDLTTNYLFDDSGKLTRMTLPLGNGTSYVYDGSNRLTDTVRFASGGNEQERLHIVYNLMSEKTSEQAQRCNTPAPTCAAWTTHRTEGFHYDGFGRLDQVNHPDATTAFFGYDAAGNLQTVRDENHASPNTTYGYDFANRLTSVTQTLAGAPSNQILTSYGYDVQDNLNSVTDPNLNQTTYLFDDFRRMRRQTSPVTGVTNYTYDPASNLLTLADANAATTTRTFDAVNRALTAVSTRSGLTTETVTFAYDDPTVGNFGKGRLRSMSDPTGSTTYAYERRGLLRSEPHVVEGNSYSLSYAYDGNGNRRQVTYPGGTVVNYTFDFADRAASAVNWVTSASYKPFGPLEQIHYANGTTKTLTYDTRYRPTGNKLEKDSPLTTLANYSLVPDAVGNIDQINDLLNAAYNRTFDQDDLNRLTVANSGASLWGTGSHAYDKMGNVTSITLGTARTASFTFVGTTPKINVATESGIGARSVSYDAAGNETGVGTGTFAYSPRNYLASGDGFAYGYDGRGVRAITINTSAMLLSTKPRRYHLYSPELNLLSETFLTTGTPAIQSEYVWFAGQPVGQIDYAFVNTVSWSFTDHLGTPFIQTDSGGSVVWRAEYEPYGRIFALRTPNRYQPFRLPGQEVTETNSLSTDGNGASERSYNAFRWYRNRWGRYGQADPVWRGDVAQDARMSLLYDRARYYYSNMGRFPGQDPLDSAGSVNLYQYALGSPIGLTDPLGLSPCPTNVAAFIKKLAGAVNGVAGPNCRCRVMLIQSGFESTWGTSRFALQDNNYLGLHGSGDAGWVPASGDPKVHVAKFTSPSACFQSYCDKVAANNIHSENDPDFLNEVVRKLAFSVGTQDRYKAQIKRMMGKCKDELDAACQ